MEVARCRRLRAATFGRGGLGPERGAGDLTMVSLVEDLKAGSLERTPIIPGRIRPAAGAVPAAGQCVIRRAAQSARKKYGSSTRTSVTLSTGILVRWAALRIDSGFGPS
jgi:hypothetical protein